MAAETASEDVIETLIAASHGPAIWTHKDLAEREYLRRNCLSVPQHATFTKKKKKRACKRNQNTTSARNVSAPFKEETRKQQVLTATHSVWLKMAPHEIQQRFQRHIHLDKTRKQYCYSKEHTIKKVRNAQSVTCMPNLSIIKMFSEPICTQTCGPCDACRHTNRLRVRNSDDVTM